MVNDLNESGFCSKIFDYRRGEDAPLLIKNNTILEFWVTWCPHCKEMNPRFDDYSKKTKNVDCYRVELEQHPDIADLFDIEAFPAFIFINKDGHITKWVGEVPLKELEDMANEAFDE